MEQPGGHGVKDQHQQHQPDAQKGIAEAVGDGFPLLPLAIEPPWLQPAFALQPLVVAFALVEQFGLGDASGEDHRVHREFLEPEMRVEEVDREDEAGRQQCLVGVNDQRDVDDPAGQEAREEFGEPHDQAGSADDGNAPEHGEVVKLLPVGPAVKLRPRSFAEEPLLVRDEIAPVLQVEHRVGAEDKGPESSQLELARSQVAIAGSTDPAQAEQ